MTGTTQWTAERALLAARNSDLTGFAWRAHDADPAAAAHQFPTSGPWMNSRCGQIRWTVRWWRSQGRPRSRECAWLSEAAIEREAAAILAVAAREAVAR